MNRLQIIPLKPEHASIAHYLRQADIDEIHATTDLPVDMAVAYSIAGSDKGYTAILDNVPCAVFGIAQGIIWLVGTDEITKHPVTFYKLSRKIFPVLTNGYDFLYNHVDTHNILSLRWLLWLGFHVEQNINGLHFVWWRRKE